MKDKEFLEMIEKICNNSLQNASHMFNLPIYEINQVLIELNKRKMKL